jgi:hypothetical protein
MQLAPPAPDLPFAPTAEPSPPLEDAISFDDAPTNLGADDLDDPETLPPGPSDTIPPDSDQRATIPPLDDLPEVALTPARRDREAGETTQTISLAELRSAAAIMPFRSVEADDTEPLGTGTVRGQSPVAASRKPYRAPLETIVEDPSTPQPGASLDPSTGLPFSKAPSTVPPPPLSGDAAYPAMPPDKLVAISNVSGWETGTDSPAWSAVPGPPRAPAFTPIARPVARRADPLLAADVIARVRLADAADRPALLHSGGLSELGFALGVARWIDAIDDEVVEGRTERLAEILSALHDEELRKKALADAGERRPDARAR